MTHTPAHSHSAHVAKPTPSVPTIARSDVFDAIVVGSGITGGWAAKELTEKGLRTLVLERGRPVVHGADYVTEHMPPWESPFRGKGDRKRYEQEQPVQSSIWPFNEGSAHWFINDRENPFAIGRDPVVWVRGDHVGGRSIMWGRQCYRWSDLDFTANAREAIEVDWPIRYADIAPWYDYVEAYVGISGERLGLPHVPDGPFLPPMPMNAVERHVRAAIEREFPGRTMTIGRAAVLTQNHNGRAACHYCGPCDRGCSTGSYFSSLAATLPAAEATGRMVLRPNSLVHSLVYDEDKDRLTGVRVIDRETGGEIEFKGRLVFLCASTLGSTQILLNTKTPRFPDGLANSSGTLGHYLMDHHFKVGAEADFDGFEDRYFFGNRPNGTYVPRFRNLDAATRHSGYLRGFNFQGGAWREGWQRGAEHPGFGAELKERLRTPGQWRLFFLGFGEILPRHDNYVELDPEITDAWGIPALRIHGSLGDNELAMRQDMLASSIEMLERAGGTNVTHYDVPYAFCEGIHEMGTARMGRDPRTSVLNGFNQAHDVPNLFVTDGACMTSSACQNPSITYMALTARAVDYAVQQVRRGELRV